MTTGLATIDGEVIEEAPRAPMNLFGTDDPSAVVERASAVATALAKVISERQLFKRIRDSDHIFVEGWTLLGSMLGVFAEVEWSRPLEDGWEARAVARTLNGSIVGAAEAMCTTAEGKWRGRDSYALRSMAQTRAVSKALRLPLGFIMQLAGYSATPAEEVPDEQPGRDERALVGGAPARTPAPVQRTAEEQTLRNELWDIPGMTEARGRLLADAVGVKKGTTATVAQLREMLILAVTPLPEPPEPARAHAVAPADTPSSGAGTSEAATVPAEGVPPPSAAPAPEGLLDSILEVTGGELVEDESDEALLAAEQAVRPKNGRTVEEAIADAEARAKKAKVRA